MSCEIIGGEGTNLAPGWLCCECGKNEGGKTYNGHARTVCKHCGHERCDPLRSQWVNETGGKPRSPS